MNSKHYPESLKALPIWTLWRLEPDRKGRQTKIPYSPHYDGRASSTNPKTWGTFDEAVRKNESRPGYYNGIALIISKDYDLVFIDIDHCVDADGVLNETASDIVGSFGEQYMEFSQSGTGIHIIARGSIPKSFKNSQNGVEMYGDKRFVALTGNAFDKSEPTEEQPVIDELYRRYKTPDKPKKPVKSKNRTSKNGDQWVIDHAKGHGRFDDLFSGDWSSAGYGSQSEADLSLCLILAFWTDCDSDQIDRIFRASGLYRDKWDRDDYRNNTIQNAIDQCGETLSDYISRKSIDAFIDSEEPVSKGGAVNHQVILDRIQEIDPYNKDIYRKRDDLTLSRLFSDVFRDRIRYNVNAKEYFYYDGRVWKRDTGTMIVEGYMKTFIKALTVYSLGVDDSDYIKFIAKYGDRNGRKRLIEDARSYNFVEQKDFDQDPDLFNCQNCVMNLKTGQPLQHDPDLLLSKISNVIYDPDVRSEDFDRFIHQIMMDDEDKILYLQKIFGYCLTGENTQEQCYMFYGSTTRNGKSTLLETIVYLFGDYGTNAQPETFEQRSRDSRSASGDVARLDGSRFLHMGEPPKRMKLDVALLKNMTGRDPITARNMYEREFQFIPVFKLVMNTNYLPVVTDDTLFSSERVKVVTFDRHFEPEEQDRQLKGRLKRDYNITGIFNWCLDGLRAFQQDGGILIEPDAVKRATEDYRQKSDKIQNFINDVLIRAPGQNTAIKDVYLVFGVWCRDNGFGTENKSNFIADMQSKGIFAKTGTIAGRTVKNVIKDYVIDDSYDDYSYIPF